MSGGGIAGLAAAIALSQRGFEVDVLEQQIEPRELGAGITIWANGARVLTALGLDPLLEPVKSFVPGSRLRDGRTGFHVAGVALGESYAAHYGAPMYGLHRGDLRTALLTAAHACPGVRIHLGQRVSSVTQSPERVSIETERGMRASGEVLIGADGIRSAVRSAVAGPDAPRFSGEVVWRALVRRERLGRAAAEDARYTTIWAGSDRHFLHYPIRGEELLNLGGFVESDEWRSESWTETGEKSDFDRLYARFHPIVREMIDAADVCFVQAIHERAPLEHWFAGRAVLVGDALHAAPPHLGQGAGMAIEDAVVLARLLAEHRSDPGAAFQAFQDKRQARIARFKAAVLEAGRLFNYGNPVRGALVYGASFVMSRLARQPGTPNSHWLDTYDALAD